MLCNVINIRLEEDKGFDSGYSNALCTQTFHLLIQITGFFPFWWQFSIFLLHYYIVVKP
jgi:hypothetical protein